MAQDSDPNVGVGTPLTNSIPPGVASSLFVPPVRTLLSLGEYAHIMGINPIMFMSGDKTGYFPSDNCLDRWQQYAWQDDSKASRDELAREIQQAEKDILRELGYPVGPSWFEDEVHDYPRYSRKGWVPASMLDLYGLPKTIRVTNGKIITTGKRAVELLDSVAVEAANFADQDGDGLNETIIISCATTHSEVYRHKLYYTGHGGDPMWEIRPVRHISISGGVVTFQVYAWFLFDPDILAAFPGTSVLGMTPINPADITNYIGQVDVYYEYPDRAEEGTLIWRNGGWCTCGELSCLVCTGITQTACASIDNALQATISVEPATWDADTETFSYAALSCAGEPDKARVSYQAGAIEQTYFGDWRVPEDLARAIAFMATARLPRPLCTHCQNLRDKEKWLRTDMAITMDNESGTARFVTREMLRAKFGTRMGEIEAWRTVNARLVEGNAKVRVGVFA